MGLINQLKSEHEAILTLLKDAQTLGLTTAEGGAKLKKAKHIIISHLEKEERDLYPRLKQNERLASHFRDEMSELSKVVIKFFSDWEAGMDGMELAKQTGGIVGALRARILREETQLYPAYESENAA